MDRNVAQFDTYVEENKDKVQGKWKYFMDDIRGKFVLFQDEDGYYARFTLDNNKFIKTEVITKSNDTLFVDETPGKFYVLSKKGNLNVFYKNRTITTLVRI